MKKYFITATDTEVGKTYTGCLICKYFKEKNKNFGFMKPIETGIQNNQNPDFKLLAKASENFINPIYLFKEPLAPFVAAQKDGVVIDIDMLIKKIKKLESEFEYFFIEGAGGLMVPIWENFMIIDLIKELNYEVILIGRTNLGTVNHTLLSIEALQYRNIKIKSIILNEIIPTPKEQIFQNKSMIENFSGKKIDLIISNNIQNIPNFSFLF